MNAYNLYMSRFISIHMNLGKTRKSYIVKRREYIKKPILLIIYLFISIFHVGL
uniref:Uncharacterized protein n=1 Tax=Oryza brachyantha TaxID=4533 RepID=J3NCN6_ORYBR